MLRVAYVSADPGVPVFGSKGCSIHVQEVVRAFLALGADVEIITSRPGGSIPSDLIGLEVHPLPVESAPEPAEREKSAQAANLFLGDTLAAKGPFDLVYERYSLWSHAAVEWASENSTPLVLEVNAPLIEEQEKHRVLVDRETALQASQIAFAQSDRLVAVSERVATYLRGFPGLDSKILVLPNAVDPTRFHPGVPPIAREPGRFTVGFLGSLKPWHGVDILVQAFTQLNARRPASRLLIVGDGPERGKVEKLTRRLGVAGCVQFAGAVPPATIPAWLTSMDVAAAPYPSNEDFYFSPLKVYEYMAAGLPVVASRVGQLQELIEDGVSGLLCPPGDASALAASLEILMVDSEWASRLGRNARRKVASRHTWINTVKCVLSSLGLGLPEPSTEEVS